MPFPKKKFTSAALLALFCLAIPACQRTKEFPPPPSPTCTPGAAPVAVPVTISLASGNTLKADPDDVHVSVDCNQFAEWSADPAIADFVVIFKPVDDPKSKKLDKPDCANKKCKTKVPVKDQYGKHPYAIVALVNGQLLVLDPQVSVDP